VLQAIDDDEEDDIQSNEVFETGRINEIINQERDITVISDDDDGDNTSETGETTLDEKKR
jgi:hypothetical protein